MSTEIVLHVEGLEFRADSVHDEPRASDSALAERLGETVKELRRIARRQVSLGFLSDSEVRSTLVHYRGRPFSELWFTEVGALKLITKVNTPKAHALVAEMVRVYRAATSELRAPLLVQATVPDRVVAEIVNGPRIADDPRMRDRLRKMIKGAVAVTGRSHQAIHGALRKGVTPSSSVYLASQLHFEKLCNDVLDITDGRWLLPAPRHARLAQVVDIRQTSLPFQPRAS